MMIHFYRERTSTDSLKSLLKKIFDVEGSEETKRRSIKPDDKTRLKILIKKLEREFLTSFSKNKKGDFLFSRVELNEGGKRNNYIITVDINDEKSDPIRVYPVDLLKRRIVNYLKIHPLNNEELFDIKNDNEKLGFFYISTMRMQRLNDKYTESKYWSDKDIQDFIQEIKDWSNRKGSTIAKVFSSTISKSNDSETEQYDKFGYSDRECTRCKRIVISDRANTSIVAETLSRDPLETGGILLGRIEKGVWYIVEATDPGWSTFHNSVHHEMDEKYHNHIYPVISRMYKHDLFFIGMWHRHPGKNNRFSYDDDIMNEKHAKNTKYGSLSFIVNLTPEANLTCYYFDYNGTGKYYTPEVQIGDQYFEGTDYLSLASESILAERKEQMQKEIKQGSND